MIALALLGCSVPLEGWGAQPAGWLRERGPPPVVAWLDADGDGDQELFVSGGADQRDALLDLSRGQLVNVEDVFELGSLVPAEAARAIDLDADGDQDLLVLREDGLHSYLNQGGTFTEIHRWLPQAQGAVVTDLALGDIDRDGDPDLLVALDRAPGALLYRNDGPLGLREIGEAAGLSLDEGLEQVMFLDLDGDGRQDALLRGSHTLAFRNPGVGPFRPLALALAAGTLVDLDIRGDRDRDLVLTSGPSAVLDLDGDELEDLVVLGRDGARLYVQREGALVGAKGPPAPVDARAVTAGPLDLESGWGVIWIAAEGAPVLWRRNP